MGLLLCRWGWRCVQWGLGSWKDESTQTSLQQNDTVRQAKGSVALFLMLMVPFIIGAVFCLLGLALICIGMFGLGSRTKSSR